MCLSARSRSFVETESLTSSITLVEFLDQEEGHLQLKQLFGVPSYVTYLQMTIFSYLFEKIFVLFH